MKNCIYLFACGLFNDAVDISDYVTSNGKTIAINQLAECWMVIVAEYECIVPDQDSSVSVLWRSVCWQTVIRISLGHNNKYPVQISKLEPSEYGADLLLTERECLFTVLWKRVLG